jgi:hypothetical protein
MGKLPGKDVTMNALAKLADALASLQFERTGGKADYRGSFTMKPGITAIVEVRFLSPIHVGAKEETITRLFVGEPVCNISGSAVGTGSMTATGPDTGTNGKSFSAGSRDAARDLAEYGDGKITIQVSGPDTGGAPAITGPAYAERLAEMEAAEREAATA